MPDTPSEPISSLSASIHTAVRSGSFQLEQGRQGGVGAHPVVMAVGADEGAVEAHVHRPEGGDGGQLRGDEVLLHDAVLPVQQLQDGQLHPVAPSSSARGRLPTRIFRLSAGMASPRGFFTWSVAQVGQQVVDGEHGVVRPVAHRDPHHLSVLQRHHAVELQGNGHPLVLSDAAVVVGLEEAQLVALVQGVLLQVQPGESMWAAPMLTPCSRLSGPSRPA